MGNLKIFGSIEATTAMQLFEPVSILTKGAKAVKGLPVLRPLVIKEARTLHLTRPTNVEAAMAYIYARNGCKRGLRRLQKRKMAFSHFALREVQHLADDAPTAIIIRRAGNALLVLKNTIHYHLQWL